jgi:hypothetical protein
MKILHSERQAKPELTSLSPLQGIENRAAPTGMPPGFSLSSKSRRRGLRLSLISLLPLLIEHG